MAAPIYSQAEADALIAMPKWVEHEAFLNLGVGRPNEDFVSVTFKVFPCDADSRAAFRVVLHRNNIADHGSVTLEARIGTRPFEGFARYDVHDIPHENPPWFSPLIIFKRQPHYHKYHERAVLERDKWHACATPLPHVELTGRAFEQQLLKLRHHFFPDMHISFSDSISANHLLFKLDGT